MRIVPPWIALLVSVSLAGAAAAQSPIIEPVLPKVTETTEKGETRTLSPDELSNVDVGVYERFQMKDAPDEIFAFETTFPGWGCRGLAEILIYGPKAEVRFYPDDCPFRYFHRNLSPGELNGLNRFVADKAIDQLKDLDEGEFDGVEYHYFHYTPKGGRRLRINNPPEDEDRLRELPKDDPRRVYVDLAALFARLANPDRLAVKYFDTRLPKNLEVLYAHPKQELRAVWAKGDDVRVLAGESGMMPRDWRFLSNGKLGWTVSRPDGFSPFSTRISDSFDVLYLPAREKPTAKNRYHKEPREFYFSDDSQPWQVVWESKAVRGGRSGLDHWGTWICEKGRQPEKLFDKAISHQLVSPDGHWLVGTLDKKLVCYDLNQRKAVPIDDAETVSSFYASYYLPDQHKVLLIRPEQVPPRSYEHWQPEAVYRLLDPATGKTSKIERMDYWAQWQQHMSRPFQPTLRPNVMWFAVKGPGHTMLGRFDTKTFRFLNWTRIEPFEFDSDHVWVDEPAKKFYFIFRGHLLRLPLPDDVLKDWSQ